MSRPKPTDVKTVAIIGTGVIGGGWAAHFLRNGMNVIAHDPGPGSEQKLREKIAAVWPTLERLGLHPAASQDKLSFAPDIATAVARADFIQESTPERIDIKWQVMGEIDAAAPVESIIASSTSGYAMTEMAQHIAHPERCVVAHPFNPPYIIPLVEVVKGENTTIEALDWACDFYKATGKKPLRLTQEVPGFVADRILEAVWREALHMVDNGMATVAEIDAAMRYGPGLRWAMMGPLTVYHLAGGEGGMAHCIHQFGPSLEAPWTFLKAPELTDELAQAMVDGCEGLTEGRSIADLEAERDQLLIPMIDLLEESTLWHLGEDNA